MKIVAFLSNNTKRKLATKSKMDIVFAIIKKLDIHRFLKCREWYSSFSPDIIFAWSKDNSLEIISYNNNLRLLMRVKRLIYGMGIPFGKGVATVTKVLLSDEEFSKCSTICFPINSYELKTPMIIGDIHNNKQNILMLRDLTRDIIIQSILIQNDQFANCDLRLEKENLIVDVTKLQPMSIYNPLIRKSVLAVKCRIATNCTIPRFIGYYTALGYGETTVYRNIKPERIAGLVYSWTD